MQYYRVERNTSRVNREFRLKRTENMIYSPQQGIPLGEAAEAKKRRSHRSSYVRQIA